MDFDMFEMAALEIISELNEGKIKIQDISGEQLKTVLAYELWKDGMDKPEVKKFLKNDEWSKDQIIEYLTVVFGYNL